MSHLGIFTINKPLIKNIPEFENLLDKFFYSNDIVCSMDKTILNKFSFKLEDKQAEQIRKRIYVSSNYYKSLFELTKKKLNIKTKPDLNKLINTILSQDLKTKQEEDPKNNKNTQYNKSKKTKSLKIQYKGIQ